MDTNTHTDKTPRNNKNKAAYMKLCEDSDRHKRRLFFSHHGDRKSMNEHGGRTEEELSVVLEAFRLDSEPANSCVYTRH